MTFANLRSVEQYRALCDNLSTPLPVQYTIAQAACLRWASDPSRVAMLVPTDGGVRQYSFAEVAKASARLANALRALGVGRGDRVVVALPQTFECAIAHVAIQRLAAIAVPVSTLYGPDALEFRLVASDARVALAWAESHAWIAEHDLRDACQWIVAGGDAGFGRRFDDVLAVAASSSITEETAIDDPAFIVYTSGTTGPAKGVLHAQRVVPAHAEPLSLAHNFFPQEGDIFWSPAEWAWAGGLVDCLFAAWTAGRPIVAWRPRRFDPEAVVEMLELCRVTNTFLPPTALRMLRDLPDMKDRAGRLLLRSVMTGSERVGGDVIEWSKSTLGLVPNEVFGQTEASCVLGNSYTVLPTRAGSIGMEYPRARVEILDEEGSPLGTSEIGEICVHKSTPAMFLGYWRDGRLEPLDRTTEWHRTGDLGSRDADGYFWHHGRKDDVILSAGYRIGPGEVEACLAQHPAVRAVAVVGTPDAVRGQLVTAVIELRDGRARDGLTEELRQTVRSRLAPYEAPRLFHFVDELPRTETGKVKRAAVLETVLTGKTNE